MVRLILTYGAVLGGLALALGGLQVASILRPDLNILIAALVGAVFLVLGLVLGLSLHRRRRPEPGPGPLSPRELEVLTLVGEGRPNKVIARALAISPNTVKTHLARIFEKVGARNRTQALVRARELGILP